MRNNQVVSGRVARSRGSLWNADRHICGKGAILRRRGYDFGMRVQRPIFALPSTRNGGTSR